MFIIETNPAPQTEVLLKRVNRAIGHIPPHFKLFATVNPKRFEMFLNEIFYLAMHKTINPDFFALLRFYIASQENFAYCIQFNKALLLKKYYSLETITALAKDTNAFPLDAKHKALFDATVQAVYQPTTFNRERINILKTIGWSDSDIFDAIDHGAFLFKFSKILKAYSL